MKVLQSRRRQELVTTWHTIGTTLPASVLNSLVQFLTQSGYPFSRYGKPVEQTSEIIFKTDFTGPLHWFPAATDLIRRLSQNVDQDLNGIRLLIVCLWTLTRQYPIRVRNGIQLWNPSFLLQPPQQQRYHFFQCTWCFSVKYCEALKLSCYFCHGNNKNKTKIWDELTGGVLKRKKKKIQTHKMLNRTLFIYTKQDQM